jgi:hypothetical protein
MIDSLADIMGNINFEEPPEVSVIKQFVKERYQEDVAVTVQPQRIVITVAGAALAGTLRLQLHQLKKLCQTDKRLLIRIR